MAWNKETISSYEANDLIFVSFRDGYCSRELLPKYTV